MATPNYGYEKRQRELAKKKKKEDKAREKAQRKLSPSSDGLAPDDPETDVASLEHDPYGWVESTISVTTGRFSTLTRFLMGLDPFSPRILFSGILAALLVPPAILLALASWPAGRGALMEAVAVRRDHP